MGRDIFHKIRLFKVPSQPILEHIQGWAFTASLGNILMNCKAVPPEMFLRCSSAAVILVLSLCCMGMRNNKPQFTVHSLAVFFYSVPPIQIQLCSCSYIK